MNPNNKQPDGSGYAVVSVKFEVGPVELELTIVEFLARQEKLSKKAIKQAVLDNLYNGGVNYYVGHCCDTVGTDAEKYENLLRSAKHLCRRMYTEFYFKVGL